MKTIVSVVVPRPVSECEAGEGASGLVERRAGFGRGSIARGGDGIDQDCDGLDLFCDVDADGDGYTQVDDCDDSNAYVNPGMTEDCYDAVDSDCDGEIDETPDEGCIIMNGMRDVDDDGQNYG